MEPNASTRHLSDANIRAFLAHLGERYAHPAKMYLLGGSALILLGSPRPTIDLDYVGSDIPAQMDDLQKTIQQVADEMRIEVEPLPFQEFIPLPKDAERRHIKVGQFGKLTVYVFDPYSIALSKIERGFESDLEDVIFLVRQKQIGYDRLIELAETMIAHASEFHLDVQKIRAHLTMLARTK